MKEYIEMIFKMTRTVCLPLVCIFGLLMISFNAPTECYGLEIPINIDVAPNTLNLESQGQVVTVHTDIAYGAVVGAAVTLNGVAINYLEIRQPRLFRSKVFNGGN